MKEWLMELCPEIAEWQAEIIAEQMRIRFESVRATTKERCAQLVETFDTSNPNLVAEAIRSRK